MPHDAPSPRLNRRRLLALAGSCAALTGLGWLVGHSRPPAGADPELVAMLRLVDAPMADLLPMAGDLVRTAMRHPTARGLVRGFERLAEHALQLGGAEGQRIAQYASLGFHILGCDDRLSELHTAVMTR